MIVKIRGRNNHDDFTLLGECFSVEVETLPDNEIEKDSSGDPTPKEPCLPPGCAYRRYDNSIIVTDKWRRIALADMRGNLFMLVDVDGEFYVMNDSGKTIEVIH